MNVYDVLNKGINPFGEDDDDDSEVDNLNQVDDDDERDRLTTQIPTRSSLFQNQLQAKIGNGLRHVSRVSSKPQSTPSSALSIPSAPSSSVESTNSENESTNSYMLNLNSKGKANTNAKANTNTNEVTNDILDKMGVAKDYTN